MILSTIFSNVILVNDYTEQEEWGVVLIERGHHVRVGSG